ncbi:MAG: hypothetical protein J6A78_02045, partial [Clostridia bacterium]|nr:hypothetical protein [Clostridia bacterium]
MKKSFSKKSLAFLLAIAVVLTSLATSFAVVSALETNPVIWGGKEDVAEGFAGGSGTKANPYQISNGAELAYLLTYIQSDTDNAAPKTTGKYYALTADIYLNDVSDPDWQTKNPNSWYTFNNRFGGNLDGRGFTVYGLYCINNDGRVGLIPTADAWTNNITYQNINISNAYLEGYYAGGIVGRVYGNTGADRNISFINCHITESVKIVSAHENGGIGGFVHPTAYAYYKIIGCSSKAVTSSGKEFFGTSPSNVKVFNGYTVANTYAGGKGTEEEPYEIANASQLFKLAVDSTTAGTYYKLTADIAINDTSVENWQNTAKSWIGYNKGKEFADIYFQGTLDGDGHTISGLYYNGSDYYAAMFAGVKGGATVKNVIVENSYINSNNDGAKTSVFVGYSGGNANFEKCLIKDTVTIIGEHAAGFASYGSGAYTFTNCGVFANITGSTYYGAFVADVWGGTKTANGCVSTSAFSTKSDIGFAGENNYSLVGAENVAALDSADQMTGTAAKTNMPNLDWTVWYTTEDGYPTLTAPDAPACQHTNKKDANVVDATYFTAGKKDIVCEDCGETVEEDVEIPCDTAAPVIYTKEYDTAANTLTVSWTYSKAFEEDLLKASKIEFNYAIGTYDNTVDVSTAQVGGSVTFEGFNAERLAADLSYNLVVEIEGIDTAKLATDSKETVKASAVANNDKLNALLNAINAAGEADIVKGQVNNTATLVSNTMKADLKAGTLDLRFVASQTLIEKLNTLGKEGRTVTLTVTIGETVTKNITIDTLKKVTMVKITGMSFEQLNSIVTVKLGFDYEGT